MAGVLIDLAIDAVVEALGIDAPEESIAAAKQAAKMAATAAQQRAGPEASKAIAHHAPKADEKGANKPTSATQSCPVKAGQKGPGDEPPDQKKLQNKIKKLRDDLKRRYAEMRKDQHDLYNKARTEEQADPNKGSWDGHIRQFKQKQGALRKLLNEPQAKEYIISDDAWQWATEAPPVKPALPSPPMNP
ncbi:MULTISPECIES: hypothetical protein [Acidiphilium]|uniref:Uncharacterized protein n=1 Tax=Acidiphilium rubrum TaxID=526 RepID=A0A8G2CJ72_ACIRU|nr:MULTISPECIES: hypothetical protein [Acidiphilium]SIQ46014.1 hypothetical protein SAMN05421828_10514 [Acidiphilium rubrum]